MNTIKNETGTYIELPKEKIKFVSKEAEIIFDLSMENDYLEKENQLLKKQLEDFKINQNNNPFENSKYRNTGFMEGVEATETKYINKQKEFIEYLENEKDRLSRECSQIYEDSLGKTKLVNEDIFNEVDTILSKYKEIIGVSNDNQKIMERNIRRNKKSKKYK